MLEPQPPTRRGVLRSTGTLFLVGSTAGCGGDDSTDEDTPAGATPTATPPTTATETGASPDGTAIDLREANVVGVEVQAEEDGRYRFSVTLHHDDAGEPGYANWWQVERLDGTRLGRRDLLHPHDRQPFTRSETVDVTEGVTCVVVRGHGETHGYGGQAMLVDVADGATTSVDQGSARNGFDESDCP